MKKYFILGILIILMVMGAAFGWAYYQADMKPYKDAVPVSSIEDKEVSGILVGFGVTDAVVGAEDYTFKADGIDYGWLIKGEGAVSDSEAKNAFTKDRAWIELHFVVRDPSDAVVQTKKGIEALGEPLNVVQDVVIEDLIKGAAEQKAEDQVGSIYAEAEYQTVKGIFGEYDEIRVTLTK